jgi:hypothetical protein
MKRLMPDEDTGQGIGEEYKEALRYGQERYGQELTSLILS